MNSQKSEKWKLDKHIPVAVIVAILVQTSGAIWWAATVTTRMDDMDRRIDTNAITINQSRIVLERMSRVEERVDGLKEQTNRIENKLDRAIGK